MAALIADFSLLEGSFTMEEAKKVLHLLTDAKLRYHTERIITSSDHSEIIQSKSRIKALKLLQQRINDFIDAEARNGSYITLNSVIKMEVLENEKSVVFS